MPVEALESVESTHSGSPAIRWMQLQGKIAKTVYDSMARMNPFLPREMPGMDLFESLSRELANYSAEENLRTNNPLLSQLNGANPYHLFLEGQKARKTFLEMSLMQVRTLKPLIPLFARQLEQMENFIRTNIAFTFTFHRPEWNLDFEHKTVKELDFADIVKFEASPENNNGRNMVLIAPMSGHFATLLRKTIESLHNEGYTVYITDWKSPFDVAKAKGEFTVDRYTEEILNTYNSVSEDVGTFDVLAICQPSPETLTATTYAEMHDLPRPRSLALMAGPIDVSKSPTAVNKASAKLTPPVLDSLKLQIPEGKYAGAGRSVYPAPIQILSFISTKPEEHMKNYVSLAYHKGPFTPEQEKMINFYTEYFAGMDLPHEFYRETVGRVFRGNEWANGSILFRGKKIDFKNMTTPLMTIEGDKDDICGLGQTEATQKLTSPNLGEHIVIPGAGHYGTFAGTSFRGVVLPAFDRFYQKLEVMIQRNRKAKK